MSNDERQIRETLTDRGHSPQDIDAAVASLQESGRLPGGPAQNSPGYPANDAPPGYARQATGAMPFGLGFVACFPLPILNLVIAGIVMACCYPSQKRKSALAAENARGAANWGLTLSTVVGAMLVLTIGAILIIQEGMDKAPGVGPVVPLTIVYFVLAIYHLVVCVKGVVRAGRGQVYRPLSFTFFRQR